MAPEALDRLNAALARYAAHPFYAGRAPGRVGSLEEFADAVPLLPKAALQAEMAKPGYGAMAPASPPVRMNMTPVAGGLMPVLSSAADMAAMVAACRRHLDACGVGPGDVCLVTFGYHLFVAGLFYQTQMEAHGVTCIPHGPGDPERIAAIARDHGVTVLAGNPSFALKAIAAGMPPPRVFFAGGEAFTGNRTLYAAVRAAMPDTHLIDAFSLSEVLPVGRTFPGGTGVHVFDEWVHAEVIDPETGTPLPEGERGELVLTHLTKEVMPLLRYRTGDLTVLRSTAPIHGRTVNLPEVVMGRTDQMVKAKGVKFYPSEVRGLLLGVEGLTGRYRVTLSPKPGGAERLALALEGQAPEAALETIRSRFKAQTLLGLDAVETMESLPEGPVLVDER
jgi:phenylacetate-CoA ligase